ncbi:glycosyl transferase family 2 [Pseudodesulfovibrio cashew]|uniref:Glycosyl transferase family 2 n=1 Tax=Pseudodesulfovibrio cashew TaxID=2678688 RepID=A0A6I6JIB5_9BACT|nr:glycosyl transferase family 2 [Pseudodesulfovibrio cashew]QGY40810.1 glycosyl transferase family 2 [Pseudodesulfovibrio cashew]
MNTIRRYTDAVLAFDFAGNSPHSEPAPKAARQEVEAFVERTLKLLAKSGAETLILFGIGSGDQALSLENALPAKVRLIVCETSLDKARSFLDANPSWRDQGRCAVLGDTSPWAHLQLLALAGVSAKNAHTALNPDLNGEEKSQYQNLQRLFHAARQHQAINSAYLSHVAAQAPDMSVGVILNPDEPDLERFFGQFPEWIKEIVVIWDSENVPEECPMCRVAVKHFAQPLKDFADQRNRMLDECSGEWVLSLDGDETFSEDTWSLFPALLLIKRLEGCYFPRMTFYPDEENVKVGFGLWPDLQLRLFRNNGEVRYERPVHERLTGIKGRVALSLDAPILHYSRLSKTPEQLAAKLERFDRAGSGVTHRLNEDYPTMERGLFNEVSFIEGAIQVLLLEENPA